MREYTSYLDVSLFTDMHASDRVLTVGDRYNVLRDPNAGTWAKRWLQCGGCCLSVSCCIGSEVYCPFDCFYEEIVYEKDLSTLTQRFDGQPLSETTLSLFVLRSRLVTFVSSKN